MRLTSKAPPRRRSVKKITYPMTLTANAKYATAKIPGTVTAIPAYDSPTPGFSNGEILMSLEADRERALEFRGVVAKFGRLFDV